MRPASTPEPGTSEPPAELSDNRLLRPSKTRRKNEAHELQSLGEALVDFSEERLAPLQLSEPLLDAVRACRNIRAHEARRRQIQLIGKLMRQADADPVREAVAQMQRGKAHDALALHTAERWRAELIADDAATTRFGNEHAGADLQQLRTLVRNARKDAALAPEQRSGRAYRELFRFIRGHELAPGG